MSDHLTEQSFESIRERLAEARADALSGFTIQTSGYEGEVIVLTHGAHDVKEWGLDVGDPTLCDLLGAVAEHRCPGPAAALARLREDLERIAGLQPRRHFSTAADVDPSAPNA